MIYKTATKRDEIKDLKKIYKKVRNKETRREVEIDIVKLQNGYRAEKGNGKKLDKKFKMSNKDILLHDVRILANRRSSQIDHILITPYEIFVLESKSSKSRVTIGKNGELNIKQLPTSREFNIGNPVQQNEYHAKVMKDFLKENGITKNIKITPIVLLNQYTLSRESTLPEPYMRPNQFVRMIQKQRIKNFFGFFIPFMNRQKKILSISESKEIGKKLLKEDTPARYDYFRKYGVKRRKNIFRFLIPKSFRGEEPIYVFF